MTTTNLPNGFTTDSASELLGEFILPNPTTAYVYLNDFNTFKASEWDNPVATPVVLTDAQGGVLQFNYENAAAAIFTTINEPFSFTLGKQLWFKTSVFSSSFGASFDSVAIDSLGLFERATNTDGVYFQRLTGTDDFSLHVGDGVTVETLDFQVPNAFSDISPVELGFHYDGNETISVFANGSFVGELILTNIPFGLALALGQNMDPDDAQAVSFEVDYFYVAQER